MLKKNNVGFGILCGIIATLVGYGIYALVYRFINKISSSSAFSEYWVSLLAMALKSKAIAPIFSMLFCLWIVNYYTKFKAYLTTRGVTIVMGVLIILAILYSFEHDLGLTLPA